MRIFWFGISMLCAASAVAYTPDETNEVVAVFYRRILAERRFWDDTPEPVVGGSSVLRVKPPMQTYEALFENYPTNAVGSTWTEQERRDAFESYLWNILDIDFSSDRNGHNKAAARDIMLSFCEKHNQTNFLPLAKQILLSPNATYFQSARTLFGKFARPSEETNTFAANVLSNLVVLSEVAHLDQFLGIYRVMLLKWQNETDASVFSNGVRIVHQVVNGKMGSYHFDRLMMAFVPDYAESTNRLSIACSVLAAEPCAGFYGSAISQSADKHFATVTNTLLNASEPLKVLDLSWLDEPPTNNERETDQQEGNND